jgi:hypothetical protein
VAGAAYGVLDGRDASFSFNPALIGVLDDGVYANDRPFRSSFPYMALAQSGQEHLHQNPAPKPIMLSTAASVRTNSDDAEEKHNGQANLSNRRLELGQVNGKPNLVGLRFDRLQIPAGATVVNAYVQFYAARTQGGAASFTFRGEAADNSGTFANAKNNLSQRALTAQSAAWSSVPFWKAGEAYWTPNLAPVVQEVVGRGGWKAGNALSLLVSGSGERTALAYDGSPRAAAVLYVEYTIPGAAASASAENGNSAVTSIVSSSLFVGSAVEPAALDDDGAEAEGGSRVFLPFTQALP